MCVCVCVCTCARMRARLSSVTFNFLWHHGLKPTRLLSPWNFLGKNNVISFSRESFWPRDWTQVSFIPCISRHNFYHCATWEAPFYCKNDNLCMSNKNDYDFYDQNEMTFTTVLGNIFVYLKSNSKHFLSFLTFLSQNTNDHVTYYIFYWFTLCKVCFPLARI